MKSSHQLTPPRKHLIKRIKSLFSIHHSHGFSFDMIFCYAAIIVEKQEESLGEPRDSPFLVLDTICGYLTCAKIQ